MKITETKLDDENPKLVSAAIGSMEAARGNVSLEAILDKLDKNSGSSPQIPEKVDYVELLNIAYHKQALRHAEVQFWFSIIAAVIGFGLILHAFIGCRPESTWMAINGLAGLVMHLVGFLFFNQTSVSRKRATEFYDRLRKDRLMTEAVSLVNGIEDVKIRSVMQAQMASHMAGLKTPAIDLQKFL